MARKDNLPLPVIIVAPEDAPEQGMGAEESAAGIINNDKQLADWIDLVEADAGRNFIPYTGTTQSKPMTGDLWLSDGKGLRSVGDINIVSWKDINIVASDNVTLHSTIEIDMSALIASLNFETRFDLNAGIARYNGYEIATLNTAVPYAGTTESKPMTGDLWISDRKAIRALNSNYGSYLYFSSGTVQLSAYQSLNLSASLGGISLSGTEKVAIASDGYASVSTVGSITLASVNGNINLNPTFGKAYYNSVEIATKNDLGTFVPYAGTSETKPMTGDLWMSDNKAIRALNSNYGSFLRFSAGSGELSAYQNLALSAGFGNLSLTTGNSMTVSSSYDMSIMSANTLYLSSSYNMALESMNGNIDLNTVFGGIARYNGSEIATLNSLNSYVKNQSNSPSTSLLIQSPPNNGTLIYATSYQVDYYGYAERRVIESAQYSIRLRNFDDAGDIITSTAIMLEYKGIGNSDFIVSTPTVTYIFNPYNAGTVLKMSEQYDEFVNSASGENFFFLTSTTSYLNNPNSGDAFIVFGNQGVSIDVPDVTTGTKLFIEDPNGRFKKITIANLKTLLGI